MTPRKIALNITNETLLEENPFGFFDHARIHIDVQGTRAETGAMGIQNDLTATPFCCSHAPIVGFSYLRPKELVGDAGEQWVTHGAHIEMGPK